MKRVYSHSPVTAAHVLSDQHGIIGEGASMRLYDFSLCKELSSLHVLPSAVVHGFRTAPHGLSLEHGGHLFSVFGQKSLTVVSVFPDRKLPLCHVTKVWEMSDWIFDCRMMANSDSNLVVVALAHNVVCAVDWTTGCVTKQYCCEENCILYSATFIGSNFSDLTLAGGTVFGHVILWAVRIESAPETTSCDKAVGRNKVLQRLKGHKGVIFDIAFCESERYICSVSDDRSVRLWRWSWPDGSDQWERNWEGATFTLIFTSLGHTARVWKAAVLPDRVITVGEDSKCCVWSLDGTRCEVLSGHKGKSVRSLGVDVKLQLMVTGGQDSSVVLWDLNQTAVSPVKQCLSTATQSSLTELPDMFCGPRKDFPRAVGLFEGGVPAVMSDYGELFTVSWSGTAAEGNESPYPDTLHQLQDGNRSKDYNIVAASEATATGQCVVKPGKGEPSFTEEAGRSCQKEGKWVKTVLMNDSKFRSYTSLAMCDCGQLLAVGGLSGWVKIFKQSQGSYIAYKESQLFSGKVISLVFCPSSPSDSGDNSPKRHLLCCGPEGSLVLLKIAASNFEIESRWTLPDCSQRFTTCAVIIPEHAMVACGDRTGSLHIFSVNAEEERSEALQTHQRIHGKMGVTDMCYHSGNLYTAGRDGCIHLFSSCDGSLHFVETQKMSVGFDWIGRLRFTRAFGLLVIGFHSSEFVVWDMNRSQYLLRLNCGGGHRAWDFLLSDEQPKGEEQRDGCTAKADFMFIRSGKVLLSRNHLRASHISIKESQQGSKVTDIVSLQMHADTNTDSLLYATCGDDSVITISSVSLTGCVSVCHTLRCLQDHCSSIKCLFILNSEDGDSKSSLLFSAGGRALVVVYRITVTERNTSSADSWTVATEKLSTFSLTQFGRFHLKSTMASQFTPSTEVRILGVTGKRINGKIYTVLACSDGHLYLALFEESQRKMSVLCKSECISSCLLTIAAVNVPAGCHADEGMYVVSGSTDGYARIWQVSPSQKTMSVMLTIAAHKSGVNSCDFLFTTVLDNSFFLATGGDDGGVTVALISYDERNTSSFSVVNEARVVDAHSSTVTSVRFLGERPGDGQSQGDGVFFLSCSVDQRVCQWSARLDGSNLLLQKQKMVYSDVADISACTLLKQRDGSSYLAVCGEGMDLLQL